MRSSSTVKRLAVAALGIALATTSPAAGAPAEPAPRAFASRVDAYVKPYLDMHAFSGTVLIARRGKVLVSRGYGSAEMARRVPPSASTKFGIGSITKTVTAAAIEKLAGQGRLALGDPVSKYLPGFDHGDVITIANLLEHSSGLKDYYAWEAYASGRDKPISREAFLAQAQAEPLDFPPGSKSTYSNTGYYVLAAIVERASGTSYDDFVRRELFAPLGMTRSGDLRDGVAVDGLAAGYDAGFPPTDLQPAPSVSRTWLEGNGSVYSTAPDLVRWLEAIRRHELPNVDAFPYPYGWGKRTRFGREMLEQNGRIPIGFASYVGLYPKDDLVVVVLSNIQAEVAEPIGIDLAAIAFGEPYSVPAPRRRVQDPPDPVVFRSYEGRYEISPGFALTVRAVPQGLLLAGPDGAFLPLDHEAADRFFFRTLYVPIAFERDPSGRIVTLDWNGQFKASRTAAP
jgi:CubicO group peptidase (beta-lactamase class C family)